MEKTATILTTDMNLVSIISEMESCRINEIPKHKVSLYRNGKNYNVICNHELKRYLVEITNDKSGNEALNETYEFPFDFKAILQK